VDTQVSEYEDYIRSSKLSHWRFHRMSRQIVSMFLPVLLLCALILAYSLVCVKHEDNSMQAWKILVYKQKHEVRHDKGRAVIAVAFRTHCRSARATDWIGAIAASVAAARHRHFQDATLRKFTGSLTNGLTVLAAIFLITAVFIVLYAMEWKKVSADVLLHNAIDALIHSGNLTA